MKKNKGLELGKRLGVEYQLSPEDVEDRLAMGRDIINIVKWKGLPITQFAKKADVSRDTIYKILNGVASPSVPLVMLMFLALELTLDEAKGAVAELELSEVTEWFIEYRIHFNEDFAERYLAIRKDLRERIGQRVQKAVDDAGITQRQLAKLTGLSKGVVWKVLAGKYDGEQASWYGYLQKIATVMNVPQNTFMPTSNDLLPARLRVHQNEKV